MILLVKGRCFPISPAARRWEKPPSMCNAKGNQRKQSGSWRQIIIFLHPVSLSDWLLAGIPQQSVPLQVSLPTKCIFPRVNMNVSFQMPPRIVSPSTCSLTECPLTESPPEESLCCMHPNPSLRSTQESAPFQASTIIRCLLSSDPQQDSACALS